MRLPTITLIILTLAGFALRLHYLISTHPFFDEYTTGLAARQILQYGWPVLPSGLFYEHGLLATYVIAPFAALFINAPVSQWQPAHWSLMLARWPSLLVSAVTIPLLYTLGRRGFTTSLSAPLGLLAAGLFAFSPEGMVWGGRARMYALATLLVLLAVYWAYRGSIWPAPAKYRWWAWLTLFFALLTQLGVLTLLPPLLVAMLSLGWLSSRQKPAIRPWFLRPTVVLDGLTLVAIIGLALLVKRLGQPLGVPTLVEPGSGPLWQELFKTVTYQTAFHFSWLDALKFLSRQFGVPHHFWLTIATLIGAVIGLLVWLAGANSQKLEIRKKKSISNSYSLFSIFLWLVFGLIILEMITLLDPFRRNPRYVVMYLPLFYLIAASAIFNFRFILVSPLTALLGKIGIRHVAQRKEGRVSCWQRGLPSPARFLSPTFVSLVLLIFFVAVGFNDLRLTLVTPEPAYEEALAFVQANWQPGDTLLTMNTPAAGLYLGHADGFTVQKEAEQFLLKSGPVPVDRWLGAPWVGTAADFNMALNAGKRTWFVIDTIRQPVYFKGDWLAVVNNQMEQVWAKDNALVYRTRPDRIPLPTQPQTLINATLGNSIQLLGYTLSDGPNSALSLTLFWQPLTSLPTDYTTFLHVRNQAGDTVAQQDGQPLAGLYPTSHWLPGETVVDLITLSLPPDLPAGNYTVLVGLYQLDTLERLPVANDASGENAVILGEFTLP
ncbi:MAG: hypothetical protein JW953_22685 [Anaerolineae bacterium]|nr:hypothetical protein [Anaerolineae bacterium]